MKMSRKISKNSEFLAHLAEDKKFKDASQMIQMIASLDLSSISLAHFIGSDTESCGNSDEDYTREEADGSSEDEDMPALCSDCKCGQKIIATTKSGEKIAIIAKCQQKHRHNKTRNNTNKIKQLTKTIVVQKEEEISESDDNDEASDCEDIPELTNGAKKSEEVTEEEKKRRRNEKKKLQKKKKRDKRKAEKQSNLETIEMNGQNNKTESNGNKSKNQNISNSNNKNNKKLETNSNNKNESNTNNNQKNKQKNETKTAAKQKDNKTNDKSEIKTKNKDIDVKSNLKSDQLSNGSHSLSVKSSPKSDRDSDYTIQSDAEEEELLLSSAYVAQIAQRKNKPSVYQKPAQNQQLFEAQDFVDSDGTAGVVAKTQQKNIFSNNFDVVIKNSSQNNTINGISGYNQSKSGSTKGEDEDYPKYKQFFFEKQKQSKTPSVQLTKEEKTQNLDKSVELAILANHRAENNLFVEAIDLFSQAIAYNPKDYRFYVNRSYCYDSIQDFRNALKDAEIAIKLKPEWPKCHYRKGKALAGLKNYAESEIALKRVLTLESDCIEAIHDLKQVRYSAIVDMGYDTNTAEQYSETYDSIKDALSALSLRQEKQKSLNTNNNIKSGPKKANNWWNSANNGIAGKTGQTWNDDDIYISDDEFNSVREPTFEETSPTNPFGWKALWVGNVSLNAKLDTVTNMFRKFGNLNYCNIFKGNNGGNFILVHYDNSEAPTSAMSKYQGKIIPGVSIADTPLTIRFRPNKDQKKPNYDQRLESDECYYWRTTGCARGDNCMYKHIQANKGVDKQAWMCNTLRKNPYQKPQK